MWKGDLFSSIEFLAAESEERALGFALLPHCVSRGESRLFFGLRSLKASAADEVITKKKPDRV